MTDAKNELQSSLEETVFYGQKLFKTISIWLAVRFDELRLELTEGVMQGTDKHNTILPGSSYQVTSEK